MFQMLTKIVAPLHPADKLFYITNGIKASNDKMHMGEITVNTKRIGMEIDFEASLIHISKLYTWSAIYLQDLSSFHGSGRKIKE